MTKYDFHQSLQMPFRRNGGEKKKLVSERFTAHSSSARRHVYPDSLFWDKGVYADDCQTADDSLQQSGIAGHLLKLVEIPRPAEVLHDARVCIAVGCFHFVLLRISLGGFPAP
jgi:hypothetical protein